MSKTTKLRYQKNGKTVEVSRQLIVSTLSPSEFHRCAECKAGGVAVLEQMSSAPVAYCPHCDSWFECDEDEMYDDDDHWWVITPTATRVQAPWAETVMPRIHPELYTWKSSKPHSPAE